MCDYNYHCINANIDRDLTFNENGVSFILMGTSSVCFDMLIIDDEENEQYYEYFYFDLYFYNSSHTQFIDRLQIKIIDNEEGQLIIISHQMKFQTDTYMVYTCV